MDVPQFAEETVEVVSFAPRGRVQQRTGKKVVDVPPFAEETVEMVRLTPQERVQVVEVFSGKEELLIQTHELKMQLAEMSKIIVALWVQKSRTLGQVGDRVAESGGFDPCLPLNDPIHVLKKEMKGYAAALERLMSESQKVLDFRSDVNSCKF